MKKSNCKDIDASNSKFKVNNIHIIDQSRTQQKQEQRQKQNKMPHLKWTI